jgi:hypothetical protein
MGGIGFRDIELFNLTLLGRQAWRIIQEPSPLSERILKAVYFPNGEFLEADVGASPSRIWRVIIDGRDVLKQGLIKRIGTGEETDIWNTNWILMDGLLRPIACLSNDDQPQLMCELIDPCTATWDMEKVQGTFCQWMLISLEIYRSARGDKMTSGKVFSQYIQFIAC